MKLAYLINSYPMVSLSFIRREIQALEALGYEVQRYSIRTWNDTLVDPEDLREAEKTTYILQTSPLTMLGAVLLTLAQNPGAFAKTLALCGRVGWRSDRGLLVNLIYFAEACVLKQWLTQGQIDHLHAHFGSNPATVALFCQSLGGPGYSFTVHGPEDFDKVSAIALPEKIKQAKFVVAVSSFGRSQLYRWCDYSHWPKIQIVHCGLDPSFLAQEPTPVPDAPGLVCVGRLAEQKGQLLLLQALAQVIQKGFKAQLILVGDGALRPAIEQAIEDLNLQDCVAITGWATEAEVKEQITRARAMILPSFAEGLPVVLMESLALGRPALSAYIAGIPELIQPGVSGWLVPAGDAEALATALAEVLQTSPERLTEMGLAGRRLVCQEHDVRREARKLAALFARYAP
ncbi:MAG: glycosyltransferase [Cyanobacteria bacterium RI_101]|nr:glycosyltransferase [Cyanobacteria bacterium RI_101]